MKKTISLALCVLLTAALSACGQETSPSAEINLQTTAATTKAVTTAATEATTEAVTTVTTTVTTTQTTTTEATTTTTEVTTTTEATTTTTTTEAPIGELPPASAADCNYLFSSAGVAVRYHGGLYQHLDVNLEEALDEYGDTDYTVQDCNFDGVPDLMVQSMVGATNVQQTIFLWDAENHCFYDQKCQILNPEFLPGSQLVQSFVHGGAAIAYYGTYAWQGTFLALVRENCVNYETLTITVKFADESEEVHTYATAEELEAAAEAIGYYGVL